MKYIVIDLPGRRGESWQVWPGHDRPDHLFLTLYSVLGIFWPLCMGARNAISLADIDMFFSGYNMQRSAHSRLQTKIDLFVGLLFVVLSTISIAPPVAADSDCKGDNCKQDEEYWVKIKRLDDIDFKWNGNNSASGDSNVSDGKQFCSIAFREGRKRKMYDVNTWIERDNRNDPYVLVYNGKMPVKNIPVKFEIKSFNSPGSGETYEPGRDVVLESNDDLDFCRENELTLSVTVLREDILKTKTAGTYTSKFRFFSKSQEGRPNEAAFWEFNVNLIVEPVIQISGLDKLTLEVDNNIASKEHKFCVFAMGKENFTLEASSRVGDADKEGRFNLKMDGSENYLEYKLTVSDAEDYSQIYDSYKKTRGFTPSDNYLCTDNTNMTVKIITDPVTEVPAGYYSDTMTFTVVPE